MTKFEWKRIHNQRRKKIENIVKGWINTGRFDEQIKKMIKESENFSFWEKLCAIYFLFSSQEYNLKEYACFYKTKKEFLIFEKKEMEEIFSLPFTEFYGDSFSIDFDYLRLCIKYGPLFEEMTRQIIDAMKPGADCPSLVYLKIINPGMVIGHSKDSIYLFYKSGYQEEPVGVFDEITNVIIRNYKNYYQIDIKFKQEGKIKSRKVNLSRKERKIPKGDSEIYNRMIHQWMGRLLKGIENNWKNNLMEK